MSPARRMRLRAALEHRRDKRNTDTVAEIAHHVDQSGRAANSVVRNDELD